MPESEIASKWYVPQVAVLREVRTAIGEPVEAAHNGITVAGMDGGQFRVEDRQSVNGYSF